MQKENPHRVDTLMARHKALSEFQRERVIDWYNVAMQFAPKVMACDLVIASWLTTVCVTGLVNVNDIRTLCMTERIHRELSA